MRIRKHFLSHSAATPPPSGLHDGDHHHPLIVVQHQLLQQLHPNKINRYPHDDHTLISKLSDQSHRPSPPSSAHETTQIGLQPSGAATHLNKRTKDYMESRKKMKDIIKIDEPCRKESILCSAEANNHDLGWLEGDMMIPIKKRRGTIGKKVNLDIQEDNVITKETMEQKSIMKMNNNDDKKVNMEGPRCSRVNGWGWRCSQHTLGGYALCDHHLGRGRLKSMKTNVRGRVLKEQEAKKNKYKEVEDDEEEEDDDELIDDGEVELVSSFIEAAKKLGKREKVGVVKARSLSSLLSQIDN
ncbi:uncharacterized protein [Rutidosis leptorrhynchoides]|uniref:uncharacterized protein n=1 Tax=Rutidosis leptorrhynchoides TaxID=125765 RepID=UPI003A992855